MVFFLEKSYFLTTTKNICCWWWCYNFFAGVKTNTFVDFFCFVDLFLLLLFLLLLLCLLLPGSVVLLFPFLRFRKRPAPPPPPPPKMLPPIPPSCSLTTTRTRGRRWFLPRRSRTPATAFSHAMALVSSSSSSSPPVVSSIRMEVDDDVLLGTTPTKGVFRNDASSRLTDGCARLARFVCCNQKRIQISDVFSFSNDLL